MSMSMHRETKALTELDLQIAEGKTSAWLHGATGVACFLCLIPGFPAITAVMIPALVVSVRASIKAWRKLREIRRRRAVDLEAGR